MRLRCALAGATTVALALIAATPALATRYADPFGSTTDPTCAAAAPCSLVHAVAVATAGEEVVVGQGDYPLKAPQQPNTCTGPQDPGATFGAGLAIGSRYVHGVAGRPRPRLIGDATSCTVLNIAGAGRAEHLEVIGNNTTKSEASAVVIDGDGNATDLVTGGPNGTGAPAQLRPDPQQRRGVARPGRGGGRPALRGQRLLGRDHPRDRARRRGRRLDLGVRQRRRRGDPMRELDRHGQVHRPPDQRLRGLVRPARP